MPDPPEPFHASIVARMAVESGDVQAAARRCDMELEDESGDDMTERFESVEVALDFAIANEIEAQQFYRDLASKASTAAMRQVFEDFAKEEEAHQAKLEGVKEGRLTFGAGARKVQHLALADYLVESTPRPDMTYAEALILAMKKEKAAYRLYQDLAAAAEAEQLADLFLALAAEEAKHKLRFEIEYDDAVLKED
jgi:rubrerythrin